MRAVEYDRYGGAELLQLREVDDAPHPGPGEVRVRVRAAALNPKDVLVRKGKYRLITGRRFPRRMGYDWAGEVVAVGPGAPQIALGERRFGMIDAWSGGSCAEYLTAKIAECASMPSGLSFEEAASLPLAAQTALQALRDVGGVGPGRSVLVNGASGGVGTLAIQVAKALGARVTATSSGRNLALCRDLGADEALDYASEDPFEPDRSYGAIFDVFGNRTFARARRALAGRGVFVSTVPSRRLVLDIVRTAFGYPRARLVTVRSRAADLATVARLVEEGLLRAVVERVMPLEEVRAAAERIETKRTRGKVVLRVG